MVEDGTSSTRCTSVMNRSLAVGDGSSIRILRGAVRKNVGIPIPHYLTGAQYLHSEVEGPTADN